MNGLRFKNPYEGDLMFLKMVEGTLRELCLNGSFPERNVEQLTSAFPLMKFSRLSALSLDDVGLCQLDGIGDLFPDLERVSLRDNEIPGGVDFLGALPLLAEIDLTENPISVQEELPSMILKVAEKVELINGKQVQEPGAAYRKEQQRLIKILEDRLRDAPSDNESDKSALADDLEALKKGLNKKEEKEEDLKDTSSSAYRQKQL